VSPLVPNSEFDGLQGLMSLIPNERDRALAVAGLGQLERRVLRLEEEMTRLRRTGTPVSMFRSSEEES
jgi:hypothetical protein